MTLANANSIHTLTINNERYGAITVAFKTAEARDAYRDLTHPAVQRLQALKARREAFAANRAANEWAD